MSVQATRMAARALSLMAAIASVLAMVLILQIGAAGPSVAAEPASAAAVRAGLMRGITSWGYQLKRIDAETVAASPYDLVVIDYAPDRTRGIEEPFPPEVVTTMKKKPDGSRRLVLAYVSIGEAEWYRLYWKSEWNTKPPPWLGKVNKQWRGNFKVRYWHPDWEKLLYGSPEAYLDRVLAAGFDGIYIDRADVFDDWGKAVAAPQEKMAGLLERMVRHGRAANPHLLVIMQNAEELIAFRGVRDAIDGIAKEDLLYGINHDEKPNKADEVSASLALLKQAQQLGKRILVVEYLTDPVRAADVRRRIEQEHFLPLIAPRDLGQLVPDSPAPASATAVR